MNKIFKVLWNKVRGQYVAVNELKKSHVKGQIKNEISVSSGGHHTWLAPLISSFLMLPSVHAATSITTQRNWNHTTIGNKGGVYDITTDFKTNSNVGVNKFDQFTLDKENIANLHHAEGSQQLVNFVNQKITVDGTVNSLVNKKIGGHIFFVSPQGMVVGETGVINAGALTAIAPTQKYYDRWNEKSEGFLRTDLTQDVLKQLQDGVVPINSRAIITVNGSINAANRVSLIASQVRLAGKIDNTLTDFSQLVNIRDAKGQITVNAGLDANQVVVADTTDGSGDILLLAVADTSGQSSVGGLGKVSSTAKVTVSGAIQGRENVTAQALAGNGTYATRIKDGMLVRTMERSEHGQLSSIDSQVAIQGSATIQAEKKYYVRIHSTQFCR